MVTLTIMTPCRLILLIQDQGWVTVMADYPRKPNNMANFIISGQISEKNIFKDCFH